MSDIQYIATDEQLEKLRLHEAIRDKQDEFEKLSKKVEDIRWSLLQVKKIYMERIGVLYLTIDSLDADISRYHELQRLISIGYSPTEAKKQIAEAFEKRQAQIEEEKHRLEEEVTIITDKQHLPLRDLSKLKQLFRSLIMKYHPDLTQDTAEKIRREQMMKHINKAYEENDTETLNRILEEQMVTDYQHASIELLKKKLQEYFAGVDSLTKEYKELRSSEWNMWKKKITKAAKTGDDAFIKLEVQLTDTIRLKKAILTDLKHTYDT